MEKLHFCMQILFQSIYNRKRGLRLITDIRFRADIGSKYRWDGHLGWEVLLEVTQ